MESLHFLNLTASLLKLNTARRSCINFYQRFAADEERA